MPDQKYAEWQGCYDGNMKGLTTRLSARHPAKLSRALCERIFEYGEKMGYWKPGDLILDPFFGIGTTGIIGAYRGYRVIGIELEAYFFDLFNGCECTGVTAEDWLRFYWRPAAGAYKDNRHWCPQCQADMAEVDENRQPPIFATASAEYRRESFKIPMRPAHHYPGNRELNLAKWQARGLPVPLAIKGDSRKLGTLLREAAQGSVTSPPFAANSGGTGEASSGPINAKHPGVFERSLGSMANAAAYGGSDGQINAMPQGDVDEAIKGGVTSPPYGKELHGGTPESLLTHLDGRTASRKLHGLSSGEGEYADPDNLGNLPTGDVDATIKGGITSSPYAGGGHHPDQINAWGGEGQHVENDLAGYGQTTGQIGQMEQGDPPQGGITSPPFTPPTDRDRYPTQAGSVSDFIRRSYTVDRQTQSDGNIAALPIGDVDDAVQGGVTSPPYGETDIAAKSGGGSYGDDYSKTKLSPRALNQMAREKYGEAEGQLAALPMGEVQDKGEGTTYWGALAQVYSEVLAILDSGGKNAPDQEGVEFCDGKCDK